MRKRLPDDAELAISWIEKFCLWPSGHSRGERVRLTVVEKHKSSQLIVTEPISY